MIRVRTWTQSWTSVHIFEDLNFDLDLNEKDFDLDLLFRDMYKSACDG